MWWVCAPGQEEDRGALRQALCPSLQQEYNTVYKLERYARREKFVCQPHTPTVTPPPPPGFPRFSPSQATHHTTTLRGFSHQDTCLSRGFSSRETGPTRFPTVRTTSASSGKAIASPDSSGHRVGWLCEFWVGFGWQRSSLLARARWWGTRGVSALCLACMGHWLDHLTQCSQFFAHSSGGLQKRRGTHTQHSKGLHMLQCMTRRSRPTTTTTTTHGSDLLSPSSRLAICGE